MFLIHPAGWTKGQHGWASLTLWIFFFGSSQACRGRGRHVAQIPAAKQFGVAISTAMGWMQRVKETGSAEPGQMGGHKPKAISGDHAVWLSQRIKDGDFTIRGRVAELAGCGLKVNYHSVCVYAGKLSFKKAWRLANAIVPK